MGPEPFFFAANLTEEFELDDIAELRADPISEEGETTELTASHINAETKKGGGSE